MTNAKQPTVTQYRVYWDNGNGACGVFPQAFGTEAEAEAFANNWAVEMNLEDPDYDGYTAEVHEEVN